MWYGLFSRCTGQAQECGAVTKVREVADSGTRSHKVPPSSTLLYRACLPSARARPSCRGGPHPTSGNTAGAASGWSCLMRKRSNKKENSAAKMRNRQTGRTMPSVTPLLPPLASPGHSTPMRPTLVQARGTTPCVPRMPPQRRQPNAVAAIEKEGAVQHHRCPWPHRHRHRIVEQKKNMPLSAADAPDAAVPPPRGKDDGQKKQAPTTMAVDERPTRDPCFQSPLFSPASPAWASPSLVHQCSAHQPAAGSTSQSMLFADGRSLSVKGRLLLLGIGLVGGKIRSKLNTLGGHARGQGRACQTSAGPATEHQGTGASPKQKPGSRDRASSSQARPLRRGRRRHHHARRHRQPTTTFGRGAEAARTSGRPVARVTNGPVNLPIWKTPLSSRRKQRGPAKQAGEPSRPGRASVAVFESPVPDPKHSPPSPGQGQPNGTPPPPPPLPFPPGIHACAAPHCFSRANATAPETHLAHPRLRRKSVFPPSHSRYDRSALSPTPPNAPLERVVVRPPAYRPLPDDTLFPRTAFSRWH